MSRVRGAPQVRRLIKALPEAVHGEVAEGMTALGRDLLSDMQADVPVATGGLKGLLRMQLSPKLLRLRVGILKRLKRYARKSKGFGDGSNRYQALGPQFYARIVHWGRRAQIVKVTRGRIVRGKGRTYRSSTTGKLRKVGAPYTMKVRAMKARPFVLKRRDAPWTAFDRRWAKGWAAILTRLAGGGK